MLKAGGTKVDIYHPRLAKIRVPADLLFRLFAEEVGPHQFSYETCILQVTAEDNMVVFLVDSSAHDRHVPGTRIPEIKWKKEEY